MATAAAATKSKRRNGQARSATPTVSTVSTVAPDVRPPLRLEYRDAAELAENPANWRKHPAAQLEALSGVMSEVGWAGALLFNEQTGRLIDGHGRKKITKPGEKVPVLIGNWTEAEEKKILATLDPLAAMATADADSLDALLREVQTGDEAVAKMLEELGREAGCAWAKEQAGNGEIVEDEAPEPPAEPVTKPGDLWTLGDHRLLCGDSTKAEDVERLMAGVKAEITISDPPYGIGYEYADHDDSDNNDNAELVRAAFELGADVKVWTPGLHNLARDVSRFGTAKVAVWFKKFAAAGNGLGGASVWEPILIVGRPSVQSLRTDVIECMTERETLDGKSLRELHSCPKPVKLYAQIMEAFTDKGTAIHEPFCGSGTTLIAAEQLGRKCYGMEISPAYCDVIITRYQNLTGRKAVLESRGGQPVT